MTRSKFIRLSGWSLMLGAATLFLFILSQFLANNVYNPYRPINPPFIEFGSQLSVWVTPILLGVGLLGLWTRYGDEVGSLGKNILLLGAFAGPLINVTATAFREVGDWVWILPFAGNAVLLACLSIFGISVISAKPLPKWNSLPIFAGVGYPVLFILAVIFEAIGLTYDLANPAYIAIPIQCVLLVALGYMLQANVPEETAIPA